MCNKTDALVVITGHLERADWTIEFWTARAVRCNRANRSGFRPIIDNVSDVAASRVCVVPYVSAMCALRGISFFCNHYG